MNLSEAKPAASDDPVIVTICGDAGSGKTSAAAAFPKPFIIRTQGEAVPRDVTNKPVGFDPIGSKVAEINGVKLWDENELFDQLTSLLKDEHDFKTLIIDSATGLEDLFVANILAVQPAKQKTMNAAGNGYGSAWDTVSSKHRRVKKFCEALRDRRGMNIVFITHVNVETMDPPDGEAYSKYVLQLHKKTAPIYINNVDVVGFIKQDRFVKDDGKAIASSDDRIFVAGMTPENVSKNRLGITKDIIFKHGTNPLQDYMPQQQTNGDNT